jgi:isopentenyl diphosphate isomerase/L-lactate dehydrogenase-like FMN-dependent dehydrogenase
LALGADGVGVGRAYLWGLTAGGKHGVQKAFQILKTELDRALGLVGVGTIQELKERGPDIVKRRNASIRDYPDQHASEIGYGGGYI